MHGYKQRNEVSTVLVYAHVVEVSQSVTGNKNGDKSDAVFV